VVEADAMTLDWAALLGPRPGWALVANLPYNVATPLIADLLDGVPAVQRMLVMVQKEVGERLVAAAGEPAYGAVSVKVAYWAQAALVGTVPSSVFVPQPRVGSVLISLKRRNEPLVKPSVVSAQDLFRVVRTGFAQRRKMLRRALAGLNVSSGVFDAAGIDERARAEQLAVEDWGRLAAALAASVGSIGA
jgi:16S rRNA (adenine1518-N6/adenine1519-N6)-dimethyltransferase